MARDEKKHKYPRVKWAVCIVRALCTALLRTVACLRKARPAQSTLEYALILPVLFLMILGVFELAFMWHQNNSVELASREIAANVILGENFGCVSQNEAMRIVVAKTAVLQERDLTFNVQDIDGKYLFTSNEKYKGTPFVVVKIDCSSGDLLVQEQTNDAAETVSVQVQAVHKLHFFSASIPNLRTGERIILILDNVLFTSVKTVSVAQT